MDRNDKKKQILKAAKECFARFGYEKTTMEDIGRLVGLNQASLYYYYKNKEAIYADAIIGEIDAHLDQARSRIDEAGACRETILAYMEDKIRGMQATSNAFNLSLESMRRAQPAFLELRRIVQDKEISFLDQILKTGLAKGEIKPCDTTKVAVSLLTIVDAAKMKAIQKTDAHFINGLDYRKMEEEVIFTVSLILDGLSR